MSDIGEQIQKDIDRSISTLSIALRLDIDRDIEVVLNYCGEEVSSCHLSKDELMAALEL